MTVQPLSPHEIAAFLQDSGSVLVGTLTPR